MKVMFSGQAFPEMPDYLIAMLKGQHEVMVWDGSFESLPSDVDILIPRATRIGPREMDRSGAKLIQQFGVGLDGVDLAAAKERGIAVANVPGTGANADSVAEHALMLMLMLLRQANVAQQNIRSGILGAPAGKALIGQSVCLYGLGTVAAAIAARLAPFGVRLLGLSRTIDPRKSALFNLEECYSVENAEACLSQTDILVVCVRHTPDTTDLVGERELRWLKRGAMVVNIARGGLINRKGLENCIADGHLGGAGLDVFWGEPADPGDPLLSHPNIIATPHVAGITDRSLSEIAAAVCSNIERFGRSEALLNRVA